MKKILLICILSFLSASLTAQYYFPPKTGSTWETMDPKDLGWCQDSIDALNTFLEDGNSKALIILKDGKIVLEEYYDNFGPDSTWYWASAGKTMLTFLIGMAQEQNLLDINDSVSHHLGTNWTSMTSSQEGAIKIWHQLTMTTGMDFTKPDCTDPSCIQYRDDPGTFWYYYNPPYTLLRDVLESATGKNINTYMATELSLKTGITGSWFNTGTNNVLFSKPRMMARFGSLVLNKGTWDGAAVLGDTQYLKDAVNTSQNLNKSYGYLWWLNGKESFRLPQSTLQFNGKLVENAPNDMYAAIGKNGQYLCIIPSQNMVVVRMGDDPDNSLVPTDFANQLFGRLNTMSCATNIPLPAYYQLENLTFYPNPITKSSAWPTRIYSVKERKIDFYSMAGAHVFSSWLKEGDNELNLSNLARGLYLVNAGDKVFKIQIQ